MNTYQQSAANLETVLHSPQVRLEHTGESCDSVFYHVVLPDEREDLQLKCEINDARNTIVFRIILPVRYSENTRTKLSHYIDRVNRIYSSKGIFALFDENVVSVKKDISFSSFVISADSIFSTVFSLKANAFDFIEVLRCLGKDSRVPDDNSIASAIYYEMYPDKKVEITDMDKDDEIWEETKGCLGFDIDKMIKMIDAKIAEFEAESEVERESKDAIEFILYDDEELT